MYKLVEETRERMKELPVTVVGYGHMGDSNLHLNISAGTVPCPQTIIVVVTMIMTILKFYEHCHSGEELRRTVAHGQ